MTNFKLGPLSLVAGTCIGAGMLALPIATAPLGLFRATFLLILACLFMLYTGFLVAEVNHCLPEGTSYISMARRTLGRQGELFSWVVFLLLLYSLMAAYITGGGALVSGAWQAHFGVSPHTWMADLPWVLAFAIVIFVGRRFTDIVNRLLVLGHLIAYVLLIICVIPHLHFVYYHEGSWQGWLAALPILLASFGYHIVIPSVRMMVHHKEALVRNALWLGSLSALIVYVLWVFAVQGAVPHASLMSILAAGQTTAMLVDALTKSTGSALLGFAVEFFVLFGIATSFMGVSLGLYDFLMDGMKLEGKIRHRLSVALLTFLPGLIFALCYPHGFLLALGYAGVFVAILHGILPAAMAWSARYRLRWIPKTALCGKLCLVVVVLLSLVVVYAQVTVNLP